MEPATSGDWRESLAGFSQFLEETVLTDFPTFIVSLVEKFDAGIITILLVAAAQISSFCKASPPETNQLRVSIVLVRCQPFVSLVSVGDLRIRN